MVAEKIHSKEGLYQVLESICDPEIPVVSIREMGILRDIILHENACEIIITPTYSGCPAMGIIEKDIMTAVQASGITDVKVTTVYSPAWTTDWMSTETREKLRKFGIAAPLHSHCVNWLQPERQLVICPRCNSGRTTLVSRFGSTACKALYTCSDCHEPFDYFKCH